MTYTRIAMVISLLCWSSAGFSRNPPVGKRKYLVDRENLFSPVVILPISEDSRKEYLRDPIIDEQGDKRTKNEASEQRSSRVVEKKNLESKTGKLNFQSILIQGRLIRPRVNFVHDIIPIKKVDESMEQRNINEIFDTAQKLDIDL